MDGSAFSRINVEGYIKFVGCLGCLVVVGSAVAFGAGVWVGWLIWA